MINKPEKQNTIKPIDKLDLSKANRLRARITKVLGGVVAVGAVSAGVGASTGKYVQGEYREWSGYDPNQTSKVAEDEAMTEKTNKDAESEKKGPEKKETWIEKTKRMAEEKLDKAKKWASKETDKKIEKLPVIKEYKEAVKQMQELKRKALEAGDQIAFWMPFLIMFLATIKLTRLTIAAHRGIKNIMDPERSKKLDATEKKINEMIDMLNTLAANGRSGMPPETLKRIEDMEKDFAGLSARIDVGLEDDMNTGTADESGPVKKATA